MRRLLLLLSLSGCAAPGGKKKDALWEKMAKKKEEGALAAVPKQTAPTLTSTAFTRPLRRRPRVLAAVGQPARHSPDGAALRGSQADGAVDDRGGIVEGG